jgi:hypothetical protein
MERKKSNRPAWENTSSTGHTFAPEPQPPPVNRMMERCRGCPYPQHGLICWHADGSCLRTDMQALDRDRR